MINLQLEQLTFAYDLNPVLNNVSYEFRQGQFYSIVGKNGSGKSTLLKCLMGLLARKEGHILIQGKSIDAYEKRTLAQIIAYVPQNNMIDFSFTVEEVVRMGRLPYQKKWFGKTEDTKAEQLIIEAMEQTGIIGFKDKSITKISGGEMQRVMIARALVQDTPIMLLDEPISQLDLQHQVEIMNILKKICQEHGKTIITVLHDLNVAAVYSHKLLMIHEHSIYRHGSPESLLTSSYIKEVYGTDVFVIEHPEEKKPVILPKYNNTQK